MLNQTTTIETVFKTVPNAIHLFIKHKTSCVGCPLAHFCTLGEAAAIYGLDLKLLLNELQYSINE